MRAKPAVWRRRAIAVGAALVLHALFLAILAGDWAAHRQPPSPPTIALTLERPERKTPPAQREKAVSPRPSLRAAASPDIPSWVEPLPAAPSPPSPARAPNSLANIAPAPLRVGCLGLSRERMTTAERRACEEEQRRLSATAPPRLPDILPQSALQREFAAAYARRQENRPSLRAARPKNCALENITGCAPEDTTIKMITSTGDGQLQTQARRILPPPARDDRAPPLTGPIDGKAK